MQRASAARRLALVLALGVAALGSAHAQIFTERNDAELEAPPPPAFDADRALPISMPMYSALDFMLDPNTITIGTDGVVRYVVIARSKRGTGAVNAFYEGMRCSAASIKTYATHSGDSWNAVTHPEWRAFREMRSSYGVELAKQAICRGDAPRESVEDMVRALKRPYVG